MSAWLGSAVLSQQRADFKQEYIQPDMGVLKQECVESNWVSNFISQSRILLVKFTSLSGLYLRVTRVQPAEFEFQTHKH